MHLLPLSSHFFLQAHFSPHLLFLLLAHDSAVEGVEFQLLERAVALHLCVFLDACMIEGVSHSLH